MSENQNDEKAGMEVIEPIIVDLGKRPRKRIKKLLKGRGKLWFEVADVIDEVHTLLGEEVEDKTILPIVLVYEKKQKKRRVSRILGL